jgi:hypothetical protein
MASMTTTNQKKNTMIPGIAYPATVLALATASSYPAPPDLSAAGVSFATTLRATLRRPDIVLVEPYLAGALSDIPHRVIGLGTAPHPSTWPHGTGLSRC